MELEIPHNKMTEALLTIKKITNISSLIQVLKAKALFSVMVNKTQNIPIQFLKLFAWYPPVLHRKLQYTHKNNTPKNNSPNTVAIKHDPRILTNVAKKS